MESSLLPLFEGDGEHNEYKQVTTCLFITSMQMANVDNMLTITQSAWSI
jgi:hypothetical protein